VRLFRGFKTASESCDCQFCSSRAPRNTLQLFVLHSLVSQLIFIIFIFSIPSCDRVSAAAEDGRIYTYHTKQSSSEITLTFPTNPLASFENRLGCTYLQHPTSQALFISPTLRGEGLGSRPKKIYGERLGDGVEYHLMSAAHLPYPSPKQLSLKKRKEKGAGKTGENGKGKKR